MDEKQIVNIYNILHTERWELRQAIYKYILFNFS